CSHSLLGGFLILLFFISHFNPVTRVSFFIPMAEEYRCFVGGLAWATDNDALGKAFSSFGEIVESKVILDRETGRSRGFGFVTFASEQSMKDAIEGMNGQDLDGRNITVNEAQSRGSGGGGGGGRDRGYGDGGSRYSRGGGGGGSEGDWRS
ncbi:hypothetical protein KIW84_050180, partial [Lathyrus oleraceus]